MIIIASIITLVVLELSVLYVQCYQYQYNHGLSIASRCREKLSMSLGGKKVNRILLLSKLKKTNVKHISNNIVDENDNNHHENNETVDDNEIVGKNDHNNYNIDDLESFMNEGEKVLTQSTKKRSRNDDNSNDDKSDDNNKKLIATIQKMINARCLARKNLGIMTIILIIIIIIILKILVQLMIYSIPY